MFYTTENPWWAFISALLTVMETTKKTIKLPAGLWLLQRPYLCNSGTVSCCFPTTGFEKQEKSYILNAWRTESACSSSPDTVKILVPDLWGKSESESESEKEKGIRYYKLKVFFTCTVVSLCDYLWSVNTQVGDVVTQTSDREETLTKCTLN